MARTGESFGVLTARRDSTESVGERDPARIFAYEQKYRDGSPVQGETHMRFNSDRAESDVDARRSRRSLRWGVPALVGATLVLLATFVATPVSATEPDMFLPAGSATAVYSCQGADDFTKQILSGIGLSSV